MYITFKQILIEALYLYIEDLENKYLGMLSHAPVEDNVYLRNSFALESYLIQTDTVDNKLFGKLISNFPELIDYIRKEIKDEYL
jgi:hypothetical protein